VRILKVKEHPEAFELARSVGRPTKPESAKAKRVMISMAPSLIKAAGTCTKRTGKTLSGLIAESLVQKMEPRAS
jgi:citrate lyase beta subunit